jgi:hypothetical protein
MHGPENIKFIRTEVSQWPPLYLLSCSEKIIAIRVPRVDVLRSTEPLENENFSYVSLHI